MRISADKDIINKKVDSDRGWEVVKVRQKGDLLIKDKEQITRRRYRQSRKEGDNTARR